MWIAACWGAAAASRAADAGSCRPDFVTPSVYSIPGGPTSLSAGDMNGDGRPDLIVTTNNYSSAISVRLSQPDGTFGPAINKVTAQPSYYGEVGLFDSDAIPDVVIAGDQLYFFKGHADGTFADALPIAPEFWTSLEAGDVNGDGKLDLIGIGYFSNGIRVLLGHGDGTFDPAIVTTPKQTIYSLAVGDLNGDGWDDIVAQQSSSPLLVFLSLGNGQFAPPTEVVAGVAPASILLTDVSGDGVLDMVVVSNTLIGVLIGNGNGTFQAAIDYDATPSPTRVLAGDFDGDGNADLAVIDSYNATVTLLLGTGGGAFTIGRTYATGQSNAGYAVAADFGGDGSLDLVTDTYDNTAQVLLLRGNGDGTFRGIRASQNSGIQAWAQADFNGDGLPDEAVSSYYDGLFVYLGTGGGGFAKTFSSSLGGNILLAVGDFNDDGHPDLAVLYPYELSVYLGNGDGTFQPPIDTPLNGNVYGFTSVVAADLDGDGHVDVAYTDIQYNAGGDLVILPGLGNGQFGTPSTRPLTQSPTQLIAADLDGTNGLDLAFFDQSDAQSVDVLQSLGGGVFTDPQPYAVGNYATSLIASDLHGNGHLDLLLACSQDSTLKLLPGLGDGTFSPVVSIGLGWQPSSVAAADFNGDGHNDIVTANGGNAAVLMGIGNGAFQSPTGYWVGKGPYLVQTGDYDDNGLPDALFASNSYSTGALLFLQNGGLGARIEPSSAIVGEAATLSVSAAGFGPLSYQWRKGGVPLSDGGPISGSQTATLTIDPVSFADAGSYDVVVTDACGPVTSNAATLSVEFADVPVSSPFHDDIISIATAGITGGCGGGNYCPTSPVRRDQMAAFLLKAEHGSAYTPPACTGVFTDVPCPGPFTDWVERLAAEGVTGGCGGGNYCPDSSVTRAQMAIFLLKTSMGSSYAPPAAVGIFVDVPVGSFGADFIEDLYNRGITGGCQLSPLLYCPGNAVLRQQMATFLTRTFFP